MGRKILAILAFNVYALSLISAFQDNSVFLFDANLISQMRLDGVDIDPMEWGWGGHYIWRIFASIVATFLAGFLAGAISKNDGAKIAALANTPSILFWVGVIYLFVTGGNEFESATGVLVISIIAIPLTTYIAYLAGRLGEETQKVDFSENTVLGIRGYHWLWIVFPLFTYSREIIFVAAKYASFLYTTWGDTGWITHIVALMMLIPVITLGLPLFIAYKILHGDLLEHQNAFTKGLANLGILVVGLFLATGIQMGIYWLIRSIGDWLS